MRPHYHPSVFTLHPSVFTLIMITSRQNPFIKELRKLRQAKGRREQGLLLLEGTNLLEAAITQGQTLDSFCYTEQWQERHELLWEQICDQTERCEPVSSEVIASIATTMNPDGAIATLSPTHLTPPDATNISLGVMVERLQDPGNLGTVIRTAAATEVDGLWLSGDSVDHQNPKVLRASAGAWFQVPLQREPDLHTTIQQHQRHGIQVIATTTQATRTYWEVDWTQPSVILLGNEAAGLTPDLLNCADQQVCIPQTTTVESLNVGVSTALLLYEARRQRSRPHH